NGESRHTSMVKTAAHALTDAARGFYPAGIAMERLHDALEAALPDRNASAEFLSIAQWAVANVKEDPREEGARPRPSVDISNVYSAMPDLAAALNRDDVPDVYRRGGKIVRLVDTADGAIFEPMDAHGLRAFLSENVLTYVQSAKSG